MKKVYLRPLYSRQSSKKPTAFRSSYHAVFEIKNKGTTLREGEILNSALPCFPSSRFLILGKAQKSLRLLGVHIMRFSR